MPNLSMEKRLCLRMYTQFYCAFYPVSMENVLSVKVSGKKLMCNNLCNMGKTVLGKKQLMVQFLVLYCCITLLNLNKTPAIGTISSYGVIKILVIKSS